MYSNFTRANQNVSEHPCNCFKKKEKHFVHAADIFDFVYHYKMDWPRVVSVNLLKEIF